MFVVNKKWRTWDEELTEEKIDKLSSEGVKLFVSSGEGPTGNCILEMFKYVNGNRTGEFRNMNEMRDGYPLMI